MTFTSVQFDSRKIPLEPRDTVGCWLKRKHCVDFYEASVSGNKSCPF